VIQLLLYDDEREEKARGRSERSWLVMRRK
jgi:hypothetical protein